MADQEILTALACESAVDFGADQLGKILRSQVIPGSSARADLHVDAMMPPCTRPA